MRITEFAVTPVSIPLLANFAISGTDHETADNVLCQIDCEAGTTNHQHPSPIIGFGEAAPLPKLTYDTQATAEAALREMLPEKIAEEATSPIPATETIR